MDDIASVTAATAAADASLPVRMSFASGYHTGVPMPSGVYSAGTTAAVARFTTDVEQFGTRWLGSADRARARNMHAALVQLDAIRLGTTSVCAMRIPGALFSGPPDAMTTEAALLAGRVLWYIALAETTPLCVFATSECVGNAEITTAFLRAAIAKLRRSGGGGGGGTETTPSEESGAASSGEQGATTLGDQFFYETDVDVFDPSTAQQSAAQATPDTRMEARCTLARTAAALACLAVTVRVHRVRTCARPQDSAQPGVAVSTILLEMACTDVRSLVSGAIDVLWNVAVTCAVGAGPDRIGVAAAHALRVAVDVAVYILDTATADACVCRMFMDAVSQAGGMARRMHPAMSTLAAGVFASTITTAAAVQLAHPRLCEPPATANRGNGRCHTLTAYMFRWAGPATACAVVSAPSVMRSVTTALTLCAQSMYDMPKRDVATLCAAADTLGNALLWGHVAPRPQSATSTEDMPATSSAVCSLMRAIATRPLEASDARDVRRVAVARCVIDALCVASDAAVQSGGTARIDPVFATNLIDAATDMFQDDIRQDAMEKERVAFGTISLTGDDDEDGGGGGGDDGGAGTSVRTSADADADTRGEDYAPTALPPGGDDDADEGDGDTEPPTLAPQPITDADAVISPRPAVSPSTEYNRRLASSYASTVNTDLWPGASDACSLATQCMTHSRTVCTCGTHLSVQGARPELSWLATMLAAAGPLKPGVAPAHIVLRLIESRRETLVTASVHNTDAQVSSGDFLVTAADVVHSALSNGGWPVRADSMDVVRLPCLSHNAASTPEISHPQREYAPEDHEFLGTLPKSCRALSALIAAVFDSGDRIVACVGPDTNALMANTFAHRILGLDPTHVTGMHNAARCVVANVLMSGAADSSYPGTCHPLLYKPGVFGAACAGALIQACVLICGWSAFASLRVHMPLSLRTRPLAWTDAQQQQQQQRRGKRMPYQLGDPAFTTPPPPLSTVSPVDGRTDEHIDDDDDGLCGPDAPSTVCVVIPSNTAIRVYTGAMRSVAHSVDAAHEPEPQYHPDDHQQQQQQAMPVTPMLSTIGNVFRRMYRYVTSTPAIWVTSRVCQVDTKNSIRATAVRYAEQLFGVQEAVAAGITCLAHHSVASGAAASAVATPESNGIVLNRSATREYQIAVPRSAFGMPDATVAASDIAGRAVDIVAHSPHGRSVVEYMCQRARSFTGDTCCCMHYTSRGAARCAQQLHLPATAEMSVQPAVCGGAVHARLATFAAAVAVAGCTVCHLRDQAIKQNIAASRQRCAIARCSEDGGDGYAGDDDSDDTLLATERRKIEADITAVRAVVARTGAALGGNDSTDQLSAALSRINVRRAIIFDIRDSIRSALCLLGSWWAPRIVFEDPACGGDEDPHGADAVHVGPMLLDLTLCDDEWSYPDSTCGWVDKRTLLRKLLSARKGDFHGIDASPDDDADDVGTDAGGAAATSSAAIPLSSAAPNESLSSAATSRPAWVHGASENISVSAWVPDYVASEYCAATSVYNQGDHPTRSLRFVYALGRTALARGVALPTVIAAACMLETCDVSLAPRVGVQCALLGRAAELIACAMLNATTARIVQSTSLLDNAASESGIASRMRNCRALSLSPQQRIADASMANPAPSPMSGGSGDAAATTTTAAAQGRPRGYSIGSLPTHPVDTMMLLGGNGAASASPAAANDPDDGIANGLAVYAAGVSPGMIRCINVAACVADAMVSRITSTGRIVPAEAFATTSPAMTSRGAAVLLNPMCKNGGLVDTAFCAVIDGACALFAAAVERMMYRQREEAPSTPWWGASPAASRFPTNATPHIAATTNLIDSMLAIICTACQSMATGLLDLVSVATVSAAADAFSDLTRYIAQCEVWRQTDHSVLRAAAGIPNIKISVYSPSQFGIMAATGIRTIMVSIYERCSRAHPDACKRIDNAHKVIFTIPITASMSV